MRSSFATSFAPAPSLSTVASNLAALTATEQRSARHLSGVRQLADQACPRRRRPVLFGCGVRHGGRK